MTLTIGLPTFNRCQLLDRAIESVLAQTFGDFELLIADNASPDGTEALCRRYAAQDSRVRYVRHATNLGGAANFRYVNDHAHTPYFLWLSDDDWLDPDYLAACVTILKTQPDVVAVCGTPRFVGDHLPSVEEPLFALLEDSPAARVEAFFRQVMHNHLFYSVMRREAIQHIPFPDTFGNDWLVTAALAAQGKIARVDVPLFRTRAGASASWSQLCATYGLREDRAWLWLGRYVAGDILWRNPVYRSLSLHARARLALRCADAVWTHPPMPDWWGRYDVWRRRLVR